MCSIGEEIEAMDFWCVLADATSFVKSPLIFKAVMMMQQDSTLSA